MKTEQERFEHACALVPQLLSQGHQAQVVDPQLLLVGFGLDGRELVQVREYEKGLVY